MHGIDDDALHVFSRIKRNYFSRPEFDISVKIMPAENKSGKAVFFFHGWGSDSKTFSYLVQKIRKKHHVALFDYPLQTVSDDIKKTISYFHSISDRAAGAVSDMKAIGITKFYFVGISLGGYLSVFIADRLKGDVKKIFICCSGSRISDTFWRSIAGTDLKKKLVSRGYELSRLRKEWAEIEPENNLESLKNTKILFRLSKHDKLVPYDLQHGLLEAMKKKKIDVSTSISKISGHYLTILSSLLDYKSLEHFFEGHDND